MVQSRSPKKTPSKFVDVCSMYGETFSSVKNKHNLLWGHDSCVRLDDTLALRDITGRVTPGDKLPKVLCGSCCTLLWRYGRGRADVEWIGNNNLIIIYRCSGHPFWCLKKFSPCYKVIRYISSPFPYEGEKGERTIYGKVSPFQKCKGLLLC